MVIILGRKELFNIFVQLSPIANYKLDVHTNSRMVIDAIINGTIIFVKELVFFRSRNGRNYKKDFLKSTGSKISKNVLNAMSKYQKKDRQ